MEIRKDINEKMKQAMREKNSNALNVYRSIISKITETEKANQNRELTLEEIIKVIEKLSKQREESILLFKQGNRMDLVETEQFQLNILKAYLPVKMDEQATRTAIKDALSSGINNIGDLMKELSRYGNLIDKKLVAQLAKEYLK